MRYYDLTITPAAGGIPKKWTSYPSGNFDPGALNILFDIPIATYATPIGAQTITVEGIRLQDISESQQYAGQILTLKAGMLGGLPLETPSQSGLITQGFIFQSFGNWIGTDMTLDFVILPSVNTRSTPGNYTLNWAKGESLASALQNTLNGLVKPPGGTALPVSINIANSYVNNHHVLHVASTLEELASFVHTATKKSPNGPVNITIQRGTVFVFDSTYQPSVVQIRFNDLIGQPTWISTQTIQVKTVLRADLQIGSIIQMPQGYQDNPGFVTTTAQSYPSSFKYKSAFTRQFQVIKLRQIGNFRASDSGEWASIFNCIEIPNG